jgi:hypothetical protein
MIQIKFTEPRSVIWKKWRGKCRTEQAALNSAYASGKIGKVSGKLYRERKDVYFAVDGPFHGKCIYCETLIVANHPGDLDHFRPKSRVTGPSGPIKVKDRRGRDVPHTGYYWLAYDYRNLLPSCEDCNRPNKARSGGLLVGKWDSFPVKGFRASKPGDEKRERPLLINPTAKGRKIEKHLTINEKGIAEHWTPEGKACCEVFGLNLRQALIQERMEAYQRGYDVVLNYLVALGNDNDKGATAYRKIIEEYEAGIRPYSAAGRIGIDAKCKKIGQGKYRVVTKPALKKPKGRSRPKARAGA